LSEGLIGREAVIKIDDTAIGVCSGVTIGIDVDLIKEYYFGDGGTNTDKPKVLKAGNKSFPISAEMAYIDKTYAEKVLNGTEITLVVQPAGTGSGKEEITINNVVLTNWEMTIEQDGVILQSIEGEGKSITFGTQS